jgi:integrase
VDEDSSAVPLLPSFCYLCAVKVTEPGVSNSPHSSDEIGDRRFADPIEGHGLLGCRPAGLRREGDAQRPQGLSRDVPSSRRRLTAAQIHNRSFWAHYLPMARAQAQKIFAARLDGRDPAEEKKQSRRRLVVDRIDDLVERFIQEHVSQVRTSKRLTNLLRRDVIPYWGTKSIHEIKKRDVSDLVSQIAQRNAHASHRLLKTLKTFFRWCVGRAVIDFSPAEGLSSNYRQTSRDRVLTDQELAAVILGARQMTHPYGAIVEFLALTGQRREEAAQLKRDELEEKARTWTIPGSRTKNNKAHIVHLSEPAWRVLARSPGGDLVFGTSTGKRFQAFRKGKRALDELCGVTAWRLHDLRRTIVSGMARLGVPPHVADKILNHQAGTISGVAAVYQRHDFLAERKEALDRWGAHVEHIVKTFRTMKLDQISVVPESNETVTVDLTEGDISSTQPTDPNR